MALLETYRIKREARSLASCLAGSVIRPEIDELRKYGGHVGQALEGHDVDRLTLSPKGKVERVEGFEVALHKGSGFNLRYLLAGNAVERSVCWGQHPTIAIADETMLREFPLLGKNYRSAVLLAMDAPGNHGAREFPALYMARK